MKVTIHPKFRAATNAAVAAAYPADPERESILDALEAWVRQRPGLAWSTYSTSDYNASRRAFMGDKKKIEQHGRDARVMLAAIRWRRSIGSADLREALRSAYSSRLLWSGGRLDYRTGQYWPTEYRAAACAVLASALWYHWRASAPKDSGADWIRAKARAELGRGLVGRWFR